MGQPTSKALSGLAAGAAAPMTAMRILLRMSFMGVLSGFFGPILPQPGDAVPDPPAH
jgi:hypothetical protein